MRRRSEMVGQPCPQFTESAQARSDLNLYPRPNATS